MIRELINFTNDLVKALPEVMQLNNKPSTGLHIFVELDENGVWKNKEMINGKDYIYYDGSDIVDNKILLNDFFRFQAASDYITMNKVQRFDPKQKIHSCSPFSVAFNFTLNPDDKTNYGISAKPSKDEKEINVAKIKTVKLNIVRERLNDYFKNAAKIYFKENEEVEINISKTFMSLVKSELLTLLSNFECFILLGEKDYVRIYLKSYPIEKQEKYYSIYLKENVFNKEEFSIESEGIRYGVSGFINTFADGKRFLKHQTTFFKKRVNQRLTEEDALVIEKFKDLFTRKPAILPNPLPLVVDKNEFKTNTEIVQIFNENGGKLSYSQIIKKIFEKDENRVLANYYLLNMIQTKDGIVLNDYDFVSLFRYKLDNCIIENLFRVNETKNTQIHNVFGFENIVIQVVFNNSLVKTEPSYQVAYFGIIEEKFIGGYGKSEKHMGSKKIIYTLIMKYRKAIYDYIYKSKLNAITYDMFDDMMINSIIADIKADEFDMVKGYHTKEYSIKEKLNIWFSLYNFFTLTNNQNRINMANKTKELIAQMRIIAEHPNEHIKDDMEFAFAAGQLINYLLDRSEASNRTHDLLEPFLQKTDAILFKQAIARAFDSYKHAIKFYHGKFAFDKIMSEVMGYEPSELNMKNLMPIILAGYFAETVFKRQE